MSPSKRFTFESWATHMEFCSRKLGLLVKNLARAGKDPFARKEQLKKICQVLSDLKLDSLTPPAKISAQLEDDCTQWVAEFWQRFMEESARLGWEVHGTTNRRLINRGIFLALKGEKLIIEELGVRLNLYLPSVVQRLKPEVESLIPKKLKLEAFMELISTAFEQVGGSSERSLDTVYQQAVLLSQKKSFWKAVSRERFQPLTKPMFRARLAEVLRAGLKDKDGRSIRFGTTVNRREAWEIFSPGEERVVQVGRIAFL